VEGQIFKIHRHFLARDSIYFQELFAGPLGDFGQRETEAIPLEGVGVAEFECLLEFFYNGMYRQSGFSLSQWITLLSISTRLGFDLLRAQAIQSIEESPTAFDPIDKLVLAIKYKIPEWLAPAYTALCRRKNCLGEWEAEKPMFECNLYAFLDTSLVLILEHLFIWSHVPKRRLPRPHAKSPVAKSPPVALFVFLYGFQLVHGPQNIWV
ncbi:hypothetical protein C8R47DRAFT_995487, partial [Mycena vitilis]